MNESKKEGMELSMNIDDKDMLDEARKRKKRRKTKRKTSRKTSRKKTGTKLCARGKRTAKAKFDVYPSAYANGYAVQVCQGKKPGLDGKKRCSSPYC